MGLSGGRRLNPLLAAVVVALIVMPIAIATASPEATGSKTNKTLKQIKAINRQTTALANRLSSLESKLAALEGQGPAPAPGGSSAPTGPAGGDLTGTYPNPQLRANTIVSGDIFDGAISGVDIAQDTIGAFNIGENAVGASEIANGSVGLNDLAGASVGAGQLTGTFVVESGPNNVGGTNASGGNAVTCPNGSRLLSGGIRWSRADNDLGTILSGPAVNEPNTWEVIGQNNSGEGDDLFARALCLKVN